MRFTVGLALVGIVLPGCGSSDDARTEKAKEAIAAVRPAYDKRRETIRSVQAQAHSWKGRSGVPPLSLEDRRKPQLTVDPITSAPAKGTNGRIVELDVSGGWDAPSGRLIGGDTTWLRDIDQPMRGEGYATAGGVQGAFERFEAVRYLALLVADSFQMPKVRSGSGIVTTMDFDPGTWKGKLLLFDLTTGELLGGRGISATNSSNVKFDIKVKPGSTRVDDEKQGQLAFESDLRRNLTKAVDDALAAQPSRAGATPDAAKTSHDVWLISMGTRKLDVIRAVRALTDLGLKDAKDLVEGAPKLVKAGLSSADADAARTSLEAAGATAEIR